MKLWWMYLKSKRISLIAFGVFAGLFVVSFLLYQLPLEAVLYPLALCGLAGFGLLVADFLHTEKKHQILQRRKSAVSQNGEHPQTAETVSEQDYEQIINDLQEKLNNTKAKEDARYREMVDYYTVWAHQIKTPLSSMKLTLQNQDSPLSRRLSSDVFRTGQYVDMVLAFLRLDSESSDYVVKEHSLDSIIRSCVRKFASEFIERKLTLSYEKTDAMLVTDEKWFSFVVEQLLSNALKYTRQGGITVSTPNETTLCITDTGIGIAPEDLPRIFEKGYTGYNGRTDRGASGLGLYLCRRVCDNLGVTIAITSQVGNGTCVTLSWNPSHTIQD